MADEETTTRCIATTRAGTRCKNSALSGSEYCHVHQVLAEENGTEPGGRSPAGGQAQAETESVTDEETRRRLADEIDNLIDQLRAGTDYAPPPFSPQALIELIKEDLEHLPPGMRLDVLYRLRDTVRQDMFDVDTWRGMWYMINYWRQSQADFLTERLGERVVAQLQKMQGVLNEDLFDVDTWKGMWFMLSYNVKYQADIVKRRFTGDYHTDEWGLDWEFLEAMRPFVSFFYKYYWRVEATGLDHIPDYGRALLVSNHSGQLPFDGAMIGAAIMLEHPSQRLLRNLYANWFPTLPFLSSAFEKMGQTLASVENGTRLLENEELVGVYPEGYKGVGKLFKDRYRLARFGRGGFVKMALNTQAPIIPVSVVGAEETYISLTKSDLMAKLIGFPYFPISPTWPWLGVLGLIPLPTKWYIDFGEPMPMDAYEPDAAQNLVLVSQLTDQVRNVVQEMIYERLAQRRSIFLG